jgi:quercetin dioxygenase-like cupin family protein
MSSDGQSADQAIGGMLPPGQGRHLQAGPTRPTVKVGPHVGSRMIGMLESELPPGGGFPSHVHDEYEEAFYVLAGEIEYLIDGIWTKAPAKSTVFVPPGRVHGFRNVSDKPAWHLAITSPAEGMTMIEELMQAAPEELAGILSRYHSHLAR